MGGSASGDTESPTLRDVRVDIEGDLGAGFDLDMRDQSFVIATPTTALFTVFARDDTSAGDQLTVEVVGVDGTPITPVDRVFESGLWRLRIDVDRGMTLRVGVTDEAGNRSDSLGRLILPTAAEALAATSWFKRFFDTKQMVTYRWTETWTDTTWEQSQQDTGIVRGGTYSIDGDAQSLAERFSQNGGSNDTDETTIESERRGNFHLDELFFSIGPYERTAGASDVVGTWERSYEVWAPRSGTLERAEAVTETLVLATDDTWTETRAGTAYDAGGGTTPIDESMGGTYRTEIASSYTTGATFFLGRIVDERDGSAVTPEPETFELYVLRLDRLLLSPWQH